MQYPFTRWHPDDKSINAGLLESVEGAVPIPGGWGPFPQLVSPDGAGALSDTPRGIKSLQKPDNSWVVYAATGTTIEELQSDFTWDDIETGRTVTAGDDVSMCIFGKYLINTDTTDGMKAYDVTGGGTGTNDAISGAPDARAVCVIGNALFGLGSATNSRSWKSTDIGDYTRWAGRAAVGGTFPDGGALVGGVELRDRLGILFQEGAIRGVQFGVGASTYAVTRIDSQVGCVSERTICGGGGRAFWWNDDGPWMITADAAPVPIGADKINGWADANIGRGNFKDLQGTIDQTRKLALWRIDESRIIAFDWLKGEFTILPATTSALTRIAIPALSVDDLVGSVDGLEGSVDDLGGSTAPQLGGLNSSRKYATFSGSAMAATIEGRAANSPVPGLISRATPMDDATAGTLNIGTSDRLDAALTWRTATAKRSTGTVPLHARGKNIAFRRTIPAGATWSYCNGVDHLNVEQR